jgi:uncharacterized membrane protein
MFGYDWPRLHAALNDLPAALLLLAVLFELASVILRRASLRVAGYWTLVTGAVGGVLAVLSGLQAEEHIAHGEAVHAIMETHETLTERGVVLVLSLVGLGVLLTTAAYGGKLVFDHAAGIPTPVLEEEMHERAEGHHHHGAGEEAAAHDEHVHEEAAPADSAHGAAPADSIAPAGHTHPPGTPPHKD